MLVTALPKECVEHFDIHVLDDNLGTKLPLQIRKYYVHFARSLER